MHMSSFRWTALVQMDSTRSDGQHHSDALSEQEWGHQIQPGPASEIILWCQTESMSLMAVHILHLSCLWVQNTHHLEHATEWSLDPGVTNLLFDLWGVPTVDLFPIRLNIKVKAFYSHLPDPLTLLVNPLQLDWCPVHLSPLPLLVLSIAVHKLIWGEAQVIASCSMVASKRVVSPGSAAPCRPASVAGIFLGPDGVLHSHLHGLCLAT